MATHLLLAALVGQAAPAATVEHLGQPCRARQVLAGRVVVDRATGGELFVLTNMNEISGAELVFVDFRNNTGEVVRAPAGAGSWALNEVPGDRLVVGTYYDGKFMVFDLKRKEFIKVVQFPGEQYIWSAALGKDGRLYGGTYPGGKLGALDLNTYAVEDCGGPTAPNMYNSVVSALPDGRLLCSFGQEKPARMVYDPATKAWAPEPEALGGMGGGVSWQGYFLAGSRVLDGKTLAKADPPFPLPPADKGPWEVSPALTHGDTLFLHQGTALYRYRKGDKELTFIADIDLRGGRVMAATRDGEVLGVRGQDYFVIRPGDKTLAPRPIPGESAPRRTLFLEADDRGGVWGGPTFGQTLFRVDARTKRIANTGAVSDGGGEVYDVTFKGGKVYSASYAGGDINVYDPEQPWDQWNRKNPRPVAAVGPAYIRPTGGILTGPDGKLYSGWMARYGAYGGAVAITDTETGKTEVIENPLAQQAVTGLAVDDRQAYVGTGLDANGLPAKKGEAPRFGVLELATKKVVYSQAFEGASRVGPVAYDARTRRVAFAVEGKLHLFDTRKQALVDGLPAGLPALNSGSIRCPGDGNAYYGSGKALVALDLQSGRAATVAELPAGVSEVAAAPDGTLYASTGIDVYRITVAR